MVWFDDEFFLNCTSMCSPYFEDRHPVLWQKTLCLEHTNGRLKLHVMFYVDGQRNIGGEFNGIVVNWIWEWVNHIFLISLHLRLMLKDDWCIADTAELDINSSEEGGKLDKWVASTPWLSMKDILTASEQLVQNVDYSSVNVAAIAN